MKQRRFHQKISLNANKYNIYFRFNILVRKISHYYLETHSIVRSIFVNLRDKLFLSSQGSDKKNHFYKLYRYLTDWHVY